MDRKSTALASVVLGAASTYLVYKFVKKMYEHADQEMGQAESTSGSGCVVEVAPKSMVNAWSTPKPELDQPPIRSWRIFVNPQEELMLQQESTTCSRASSKAELSTSTDVELEHSDCEAEPMQQMNECEKKVTTKRGKYKYEKLSCSDDDFVPQLPPVQRPQMLPKLQNVNLMSRQQASVLRNGEGRHCSKLQLLAGSQGFSSNEYRSILNSKIDQLYGCSKVITSEEAKCLVLALEQKDEQYLLKTLTTISNLAAFTVNQDLFRRFGLIENMGDLLEERRDLVMSDSARVMLVQCISNMAVNRHNQHIIKTFIPILVRRVQCEYAAELEKLVCVQALTNLTVEIDNCYVNSIKSVIPFVYHRIWSAGKVNLPMLKFLVNVSCSPQIVPKLLASRSPPGVRLMLQNCIGEDVLVRSTVLLQYLVNSTLAIGVDDMFQSILDVLKMEKYTYTLSETVYYQFFGRLGSPEVHRCLMDLATHRNSEIETRVKRMLPEFEELIHLITVHDMTMNENSLASSSISSSSSRGSPL